MASQYDEKDKQLVQKIETLLYQRTRMNVNDNQGTAYLTPNWEQEIYPQATVTREDVRKETGRKSIRDVAFNKIADMLAEQGLEASVANGGINVKVPERRARGGTEFTSIGALEDANKERIREYKNSREHYESDEDFEADNPDRDPEY